MSHEDKRPVAIEDLLRLKRAERPPAEFWERFDRELRAKQLAALVQKRPWWQTMPRFAPAWRRYHFPLGATAVLAITFVSLRDFSGVSPATIPALPMVASLQVDSGINSSVAREKSQVALVSEPAEVLTQPSSSVSETMPVTNEAPFMRAPSVGGFAALAPTNGSLGNELAPARHPSVRFSNPEVSSMLGGALLGVSAVPVRSSSRGTAIEPLAQMIPPGEARRARILSAMSVAAAADVLGRTSETDAQPVERVARSLSDDRMNDSIRRFNAKGDRFSFKL